MVLGPGSYTNTKQMAATIVGGTGNSHLKAITDTKQCLFATGGMGRDVEKDPLYMHTGLPKTKISAGQQRATLSPPHA